MSTAQIKVPIDSLAGHIGKRVTVCAKVYGVKLLSRSQVTFINMGAAYPQSPLTVVIFGKDLANFPQSPEILYTDKQICVTGILKEYQSRMEIVVEKPDGIEVEGK